MNKRDRKENKRRLIMFARMWGDVHAAQRHITFYAEPERDTLYVSEDGGKTGAIFMLGRRDVLTHTALTEWFNQANVSGFFVFPVPSSAYRIT